jgi:DNA-binding NtrC family response regulator
MNVLIVESNPDLGGLWQAHVERLCKGNVALATNQQDAIALIMRRSWDIIVLDLVIDGGSAMAVSDFASYRQPDAKVIFVTNTTFFSDGSIFNHCANACAFLPTTTLPEDLANLVAHYGGADA